MWQDLTIQQQSQYAESPPEVENRRKVALVAVQRAMYLLDHQVRLLSLSAAALVELLLLLSFPVAVVPAVVERVVVERVVAAQPLAVVELLPLLAFLNPVMLISSALLIGG
jgi:hypothetical protein